MMERTSIIGIARKLGVSPSTVSRALNNHPDIKESTKADIWKVAEMFDYRPNQVAQRLKRNRTKTIGVIVPAIKHDFFSSAISGIEDVACKSGYTIILCQSNEKYKREVVNTNLLMNQRVAGVIASITENTESGNHFKDLTSAGIPVAFFDRVCNDLDADKVIIDDYKSAFNAVSYLVKKGYKRIAHFAGLKTLDISHKRTKGYLDALRRGGLPLFEGFLRYGELHESHGYESMDFLFRKHTIPDAIFAVNDTVAVGAYRRIKDAGLRIPDDIAVLGFSNSNITKMTYPTMTAVDQFPFLMGRNAATMLIEMVEGRRSKPRTVVIETELVIREST